MKKYVVKYVVQSTSDARQDLMIMIYGINAINKDRLGLFNCGKSYPKGFHFYAGSQSKNRLPEFI